MQAGRIGAPAAELEEECAGPGLRNNRGNCLAFLRLAAPGMYTLISAQHLARTCLRLCAAGRTSRTGRCGRRNAPLPGAQTPCAWTSDWALLSSPGAPTCPSAWAASGQIAPPSTAIKALVSFSHAAAQFLTGTIPPPGRRPDTGSGAVSKTDIFRQAKGRATYGGIGVRSPPPRLGNRIRCRPPHAARACPPTQSR